MNNPKCGGIGPDWIEVSGPITPFCNERPAEVFRSTIAVLDKPVILVPPMVLSLCNAIQAERSNLEFSVLLKGKWTRDGFVVENDTYVIPKQIVSGASVDYDHEEVSRLTAEGYNCVLHSHPMNLRSFSSSDEETINVNFDASILYCNGELCDARVCVAVIPRLKLRLAATVGWIPLSGDIAGLDNIVVTPRSEPRYMGMPLKGARNRSLAWPKETWPKEPEEEFWESLYLDRGYAASQRELELEAEEEEAAAAANATRDRRTGMKTRGARRR